MGSINTDFEKELQHLRERLEEADDMRRAIARGEVDAFVVGPAATGRVLLLANAYQRYRQLVERMQQGAITATPTGNILFANQRFADMLGIPIGQLYTAPLESYVGVADRARLSHYLMLSARESRIDVELNRQDGTTIPVRLSLVSFADGYATVLITDMRPLQWPAPAVDALDSIRGSIEKLNHRLRNDPVAQDAVRSITEEINGLARMIDQMLDIESMGSARK